MFTKEISICKGVFPLIYQKVCVRVCVCVCVCACAQSLSREWLFATPCTVGHQAPLSMEFSRQEYWTGLPFPLPAYLPDPGIKCLLHWQADSSPLSHLGSHQQAEKDGSVSVVVWLLSRVLDTTEQVSTNKDSWLLHPQHFLLSFNWRWYLRWWLGLL